MGLIKGFKNSVYAIKLNFTDGTLENGLNCIVDYCLPDTNLSVKADKKYYTFENGTIRSFNDESELKDRTPIPLKTFINELRALKSEKFTLKDFIMGKCKIFYNPTVDKLKDLNEIIKYCFPTSKDIKNNIYQTYYNNGFNEWTSSMKINDEELPSQSLSYFVDEYKALPIE